MSQQRLVVLDTETTGLSPKQGHRIVEIACVELIDYAPTGRHYHQMINPECEVSDGARNVTGYTHDYLRQFPVFAAIVYDFLDFIGDSELVIHNAPFDLGFLNFELGRMNCPLIDSSRVIDSLKLARKKFPGTACNLNALCKRFDISLHEREKHSAILDTQLLSRVYVELVDQRQRKIKTLDEKVVDINSGSGNKKYVKRSFINDISSEESHKLFIKNHLKSNRWGYE